MGVPMVQTKARRRSSILMGIGMALLLGVAAALTVLGVSPRMLEAVTTFTRLSKLMVQAEPPISPNDQTLLAVIAGILVASIGWVLVDWLLFGRAGMSTLIRARDDDYEDEDEDAFRPTDPLDLVSPTGGRPTDWSPPSGGDARRPLSARTDIGDPPVMSPFGEGGPPSPDLLRPGSPFNPLTPGSGMSAPPLQSAFPAPPLQPTAVPPQPDPASFWTGGAPQPPAAPSIDLSVEPAAMPSWLPAPGARPEILPEAERPELELPELGLPELELPELELNAEAEPETGPIDFSIPDTAEAEPAPALRPIVPEPPLSPQPLGQSLISPVDPAEPLYAVDDPEPAAPLPPFTPPSFFPAPIPEPAAYVPPIEVPPAAPLPPVAPAAPVAPAPVAQPMAAPAPSAPPATVAGFERGQLEDLLGRLERGLERRRVAVAAQAAQASQAQPAPAPVPAPPPVVPPTPEPPQPLVEAVAPIPAPPEPLPIIPEPEPLPVDPLPGLPRQNPPAAFSAPPFVAPEPALPAFVTPEPAAPEPMSAVPPPLIPVMQPLPVPQAAPLPAAGPSIPLPPVNGDAMLEQPLHVTLDILRNMVRR